MSIKIQINSLDALERLIGGDNELEIEIRSSVVENFTKKHLNTLVNNDLMKKTAIGIQNTLTKQFFEEVKDGWTTKTILKPEILNKLKDSLEYKAQAELYKIVDTAIETQKIDKNIQTALDIASDRILNNLSDENLNKRLDKMVDTKIKQRLGL